MQKKTGLKRDTTDKYYTKSKIASLCVQLFNENISITNDDLIIEPGAGSGAFIPFISKLPGYSVFYDIEPKHPLITQLNFLSFDYDSIYNIYHNIHIIGNPPFGRQSSTAIKFIKQSALFANSISFILPKSFKKNSMKKYFPLNFHLIYQTELPVDSFIIDDKPHSVPCVFQIWQKKNFNRSIPSKLTPKNFLFVKKSDSPHFAVRRVGVYAGKIYSDYETRSEQSHYFIRFNDDAYLFDSELLFLLDNIDYKSKNNTVGPRSISKQELIKEFNSLLS